MMRPGRVRETLKKAYAIAKRGPMGRALQWVIIPGGFCVGAAGGLLDYLRNGHISRRNWYRILAAHCFTNGRSTTLLNVLTYVVRPPRPPKEVKGLLGVFPVAKQKEIVTALERHGFYVFPRLLD